MKHSPLSWIAIATASTTDSLLLDGEGKVIASISFSKTRMAKANTALLVKAVNLHQELVTVIKDLLEDKRGSEDDDNFDLTERAEKAIAKAEGKVWKA